MKKFDFLRRDLRGNPHKQKMLNLWIVALAKLAHNDGISRNLYKAFSHLKIQKSKAKKSPALSRA